MALSVEVKKNIISEFGISSDDTGSMFVQVALLTERIKELTEHLQRNKKDFSTKRGLLRLIAQRKFSLLYIQEKDNQGYKNLVKRLGLKK